MQIWLRKKNILNVSITLTMSKRQEIPTLERATLVFELTSFATDMLGKLIKPGTNTKKKKISTRTGNILFKIHFLC